MTSVFLARKAKTFFKHLDVNNDGFISLNDFIKLGERHCNAENADDVQKEQLRECYVKVWRQWMKSAESDDNGLLTPSILAESVIQQRNDPEFKEAYVTLVTKFFRILDVNGDGFLQEDEYARSFANVGLQDLSSIRRAFEIIDLNQDGKLSIEEVTTALAEFIISEDEHNRYAGLMQATNSW